jgi:predicted LPLAT superfamily acyltransferase
MQDSAETHEWKGRTLGGAKLFNTCVWLLRRVGARGGYPFSFVIAAGFMLVGGRRQFGMFDYWRRVRPRAGVLVHLMLIFRQYASFGRILGDRFLAILDPTSYRFRYEGAQHLRKAVINERGCILLAAHVGNWELSGSRLRGLAKKMIHLVMLRNDDSAVQQFVDRHLRSGGISVIDPSDTVGASLAIQAALSRGETVCMLADRVHDRQPALSAPFLGAPAGFPAGPFHAAGITGAPLVICFLMKEGLRDYVLQVDEPWHIDLPARGPEREAALQHLVERWAKRLERQVRRYPLQWHNFFEFWREPET